LSATGPPDLSRQSVVEEKLVQLASPLPLQLVVLLSAVKALCGWNWNDRGLSDQGRTCQDRNDWDHRDRNVRVLLDVKALHCRDCVAHTSVHQQEVVPPVEYRYCSKPGNAAEEHSAHIFAHYHHLGAEAVLDVLAALMALQNCWGPGAAGSVPVHCYYMALGRNRSYLSVVHNSLHHVVLHPLDDAADSAPGVDEQQVLMLLLS
jgi:hypothetical protein